jgi:uncharacterized membrane protein YgcG
MSSGWPINQPLRETSRLGSLSRPGERASARELVALGGLAIAAMLATAFLSNPGIRVPGHAILRGVLPMALGLALVPRRGSGSLMGAVAAATAFVLHLGGLGRMQPGTMVGVIMLGPLLDVALIHSRRGWRLYTRLMAAGLVANLLAYATRFATAWLGLDRGWGGGGGGGGGGAGGGGGGGGGWGSGGAQFTSFALTAFLSFALCGALAGLISGIIWFRASEKTGDAETPAQDEA